MIYVPLTTWPAVALPPQSDAALHTQPAEILLLAQATASAPDIKISPNGHDIRLIISAKDGAFLLGDVPVTITAGGALRLPAQRILALLDTRLAPDMLAGLKTSLLGHSIVTAQDFARSGIEIGFDPQTLELRLSIPSEMRAVREVQVSALDTIRVGDFHRPAEISGYVNFRGALDYLSDGPVTGLQNPSFYIDGASRLGKFVVESEAFWQPGVPGTDFQRQGSRLVYDDLQDIIRFTAGDLQPVSRSMQVTPNIAGFSMARSFSALQPEKVIRPRGSRSFLLERPASVEIYVNEMLVRRVQLPAGNYNLNDFPFTQGANDIKVIITDESGRQDLLRFNIFFNQTQLAKGLTEFGVYAGVKAPVSQSAPHYTGDLIFSGYVRKGLSDSLTLGANFQADKQSQLGGFEAVVGTPVGAFSATMSASKIANLGSGWAATMAYQGLFRRAQGQADSLNIMVETRSRDFAPISIILPSNPFQYELSGSFSHPLNDRAFISVDGRFSKARLGFVDQHYYRLSGGLRVNDRISLTAETRYEHNAFRAQVSGLLSVNVRLGRASSARADYESVNHRTRASYQTLSGQGVGSFNLSGDIERNDLSGDLNLNGNYDSNFGDVGFSHIGVFSKDFDQSQSQRTTLRGSTSIAFADGSVAIGRPIFDSFAIVKAHPSLAGKTVRVDPSGTGYAATTSGFGAALYPTLNSYSERTITVAEPDASDMADLGSGSFRVFPGYRSGYLLHVGSRYNITAIGVLVGINGQPVSLASGRIRELGTPDPVSYEMFSNQAGRIALAGLAPGKWRIEMSDDDQTQIDIEIPDHSEPGLIRLGTISPKEAQ